MRWERRSSGLGGNSRALPTSRMALFGPVGDHIGGHGCALFTVTLVNVLKDAFSPFTTGKIQVDIRPFPAFFREKPLKEQVHADRVNGCDPQAVANGAVGRRSTPLQQDIVLAAEANDLPDN